MPNKSPVEISCLWKINFLISTSRDFDSHKATYVRNKFKYQNIKVQNPKTCHLL